MVSFLIWKKEKLPERGFLVFEANLQAYSNDAILFAHGFQSPLQQQKMKNAVSFCLDATHDVSQNASVIMYTLLVRDEEICRGWPVGYLLTNDHSTGPVV